LAQIGALSVEAYWADVAQQLALSAADLEQLKLDYFKGDHLDQPLITYIRQLRDWGHRVALLSNDSPALQPKLEALGIAPLFEPLVISAHIGVM
jgi:FMN phosphatase YigB (HAD superfamily)